MLGVFLHCVSPSDVPVPALDLVLSGGGVEDDEGSPGRISWNLGGSDILVGGTEPLSSELRVRIY
jgi:hypothetical protein